MHTLPEVFYFHGLGSSPHSDKARLVTSHLQALGYSTHAPNLSVPNLQQLDIESALQVAVAAVKATSQGPGCVVIGSSFGGLIAMQVAERMRMAGDRRIQGLVLLAPVLNPWHPTHTMITQAMEEHWELKGEFPVQESISGNTVGVHVDFIRQLKLHTVDHLRVYCPTLIIHGEHDEVVPVGQSVNFSAAQQQVTLHVVPDTHQLLADPQMIVTQVIDFVARCHRA
jgi:pimeloyl-ACP methyl ester carboxylesterase